MKRLNDIQRLHEAEVRLIQEQSALLLQKQRDGFNGELKSSGLIVENYIKSLLAHHMPDGYRMCSGYIATTETIFKKENLIQHDVIITDGRIPPIHRFGFGDIEVVPAEAVCGVIEVKRTLTKASLDDAIEHLRATKMILDKYDNGIKSKSASANNLAGPTLSVATCAPLYAIVGLDCEKETVTKAYFDKTIVPSVLEFIDFIWGVSASWYAKFGIRGKTDNQQYFPTTVSRNQDGDKLECTYDWYNEAESGRVYGTAISCFRAWINNTSGARLDVVKNTQYFGAIERDV
jgi:hypothetical protein